jgi:hypothetical protein
VKMLMCCTVWVALLVSVPCFATCSPKITRTLPITSTFLSYDANNNPADIQSDGLSGGTYYDGANGVTTFLTCNGYNHQTYGDWQFDALSSSVRTIGLSFASPIQVSAGGTAVPNPPFTMKDVIAHVEDKCTQIANGSGGWNNMLQMAAGQTLQCPLIVHFYDTNAAEYRIYMGPNWEPESTYIQVTCNSVAANNSGCDDWFIDPIPVNGIPGQAVGRLVYFAKRSTINEGDYYFRLHLHLTRP